MHDNLVLTTAVSKCCDVEDERENPEQESLWF